MSDQYKVVITLEFPNGPAKKFEVGPYDFILVLKDDKKFKTLSNMQLSDLILALEKVKFSVLLNQ